MVKNEEFSHNLNGVFRDVVISNSTSLSTTKEYCILLTIHMYILDVVATALGFHTS